MLEQVINNNEKEAEFFLENFSDGADTNANNDCTLNFDEEDVECVGDDKRDIAE